MVLGFFEMAFEHRSWETAFFASLGKLLSTVSQDRRRLEFIDERGVSVLVLCFAPPIYPNSIYPNC